MTNGVYILKCKDQYRVRVIDTAIESLDDDRLVELFSECKFTHSKTMALYIASQLYNTCREFKTTVDGIKITGCPHGIQFITVNTTWAKLVAASQPEPQEEVAPVNDITTEVTDESAV